MQTINNWLHSVAGVVVIVMIGLSILLVFGAYSDFGVDCLSIDKANIIDNILVGLATNFIGIAVTVAFVQHLFEKEEDARKRKVEIITIKNYNKYMNTLIRKFLMYYTSVTTRIQNRNTDELDNVFNRSVRFSDLADMYAPSMFLSEGFLEPSIVLFYNAEENLREYMLKMLENIEFKHNTGLEEILLEFVTKSVDLNMRGNILGAMNTKTGKNMKMSEFVSKLIADESNDWLGKFKRGELKGNLMMPYVMFFFTIQDQTRMIKLYMDYIAKLDGE